MSNTEWRSTYANSDVGLDDSIASTMNLSFMSSNTPKEGNSSFTSEDGLLNALSNLSIESTQKPRRSQRRSSQSNLDFDGSYEDCQDLSSNTQIDVSINNTVIHEPSQPTEAEYADKKVIENQTNDIPINESQEVPENSSQNDYPPETDTEKDTSCNQMVEVPTNEHQESVSDSQTTSDNTEEQKNSIVLDVVTNDVPINSDNKSIPDSEETKKSLNVSINKSMNSLNQLGKKKPPSPSLLPKPKPRTIGSSLDQSVSKVNATKPVARHVVKTIIDTTDGIHVKDEQINHFGIPVIAGRKKRTEVQPFSFLTRGKSASNTSKTSSSADKTLNGTTDRKINKTLNSTTIKVMNKTISCTMDKKLVSASEKLVNKTLTAKKISSNLPSKIMNQSMKKPLAANAAKATSRTFSNAMITTKVNQENKTPNVVPKPKSTGIAGPPKLHTDKRAKERHEFDVQLRQKQQEIDKLRAMWEEKLREKEKLEQLALRKTMEPKAHPMPEFKVPAPIKSTKPLTVPQSPTTWAINHKK